MKRIWIYLDNPILNATDSSYRAAVRISTHHDSALKSNMANPAIAALYTIYHPLHVALVERNDEFRSKEGLQQGETLNLNQLLRLLSNKNIGKWDSAIQAVYEPDTPEYKALLPNDRKPFQRGTQTERISAVSSLIESIGSDASLATLKATILTFYNELNLANSDQKASITTTRTSSDEVDAARTIMAEQQYGNLGSLINLYKENTDNIEQYFDLEAIRKGQQVFFTGSVKQQSAKFIVKRTFTDDAELTLVNTGVTQLKFYLAPDKTALPNGTFQLLEPGETKTVNVTSLGLISNTYLMVFNPDDINKGEFDVEIL